MTANELADWIENGAPFGDYETAKQASAMLRQQQEKIDRLLDQYQQLNENLEMWKTGHFTQQAEIEALKLRELTDEEIQEIGKPFLGYVTFDELDFARAILRKASEK